MRKSWSVGLAAVLFLLAAGSEARAHKMIAASRVHDDGTVLLQAFFPDGKPARGVTVEVHRPDGSLLAAARTDEEGKLTVTPDGQPGQWTATFTGSMGHKTETRFRVDAARQPTEAPGAVRAVAAPVARNGGPTAEARDESLIEKAPFPVANVLAGLGFVFGLSALLMCIKLRAQLRELVSK